MIRIGLTGGIGMGKSTAAALLEARGVPVIDTDVIAREVVAAGMPALEEIRRAFGEEIVAADGSLKRDALAALVFSDDAKRRQLESILHPRIRARWLEFLARCKREGRAAAVVVIPLLFETEAEKEFDQVICIACSEESQKERLRGRGWTDEQSARRIASQWRTQKKIDRSNVMIWTEVSREVHAEEWDLLLRRLGVQ